MHCLLNYVNYGLRAKLCHFASIHNSRTPDYKLTKI